MKDKLHYAVVAVFLVGLFCFQVFLFHRSYKVGYMSGRIDATQDMIELLRERLK